ncbi:MAG: TetR/AcrR family transcriptional regulator [Deltaproteobacteria bacterium]|jgi:TetR/AcrR family transcriptional repressor of nem operon|nr:TetR/AcrR family transcriptional regulator [Deltaproteobacteria bacterium]
MPRKKSYDREALIGKAMELFRDHGYAGTSAEMLVEALGVNRYSLYAEFGSKQGLFDAALKRYDDEVLERNFGPLEAPGAGIAEVRALLEFFGAAAGGPASGRGCLLCNTAVELGPEDPSGAGFVRRYFKRLSGAFDAALRNARVRGDLRPDVDPRAEASFFTASVLGLFVMLRAKAPRRVIESATQMAIEHLEGLRVSAD